MKRHLSLALGLTFVLAVAGTDWGQNIVGSSHDLAGTGNITALCEACHTPHSAPEVVSEAPLWNHLTSSSTFQMYNNAWSSTIDNTVDAAPTGNSVACLSCHDGTIAIDAIGGVAGTEPVIAASASVGFDLRDDHPVSIEYSTAADGGLNDSTTVKGAGLKFFSSKVQCATCHNPHDPGTSTKFLRVENDANSTLCTTCHNK
jgi:predicted CXXCH cytochrome family protein